MEADDLTLLDLWCAGDRAAGSELFRRHFEAVYRFFEHKTDGDLDDLVQETFLACTRGRDAFLRKSSFRTYLFSIARHMLFAYWRRRTSHAQTVDIAELSVASLSTSVGTRFSRRQDRAALLASLRGLPIDQQILLEMYYWEELDREELAEVFDVEPSTIGTRLFRARDALHRSLGAAPGLGGGGDAGMDAGVDSERAGDFDRWARDLGRSEPPSEND